MFTGNDLVCLNEVNFATFSRSGAAKLILSPSEIMHYGRLSGLPLMKLWAVKEAAYKYFCKAGYRCPFNPLSFEVFYATDGMSGQLSYHDEICMFRIEMTGEYIHAVCGIFLDKCRSAAGRVPDALLAEITGSCVAEVKNDSDGVPYLFVNGMPFADISRSYDSGLVACSIIAET